MHPACNPSMMVPPMGRDARSDAHANSDALPNTRAGFGSLAGRISDDRVCYFASNASCTEAIAFEFPALVRSLW